MSAQPPPPQSPGGPAGSVFTGTAGLGARVGARLLDILIVGIPASIVLGFLGFGTMGGFDGGSWIASAITSLLWFGYFVFLESSRGATIGKQILNLKVISATGAPPSTEDAAKRNVWMLFGLVPWIGGIAGLVAVIVIMVTISSDNRNRGYHDTFAGTAVMRA